MECDKLTKLREEFLDQLRSDLHDPEKANPNLYKVIRETLRDMQPLADALPNDSLKGLDVAPFKIAARG
jgi:hypothetical protein